MKKEERMGRREKQRERQVHQIMAAIRFKRGKVQVVNIKGESNRQNANILM